LNTRSLSGISEVRTWKLNGVQKRRAHNGNGHVISFVKRLMLTKRLSTVKSPENVSLSHETRGLEK